MKTSLRLTVVAFVTATFNVCGITRYVSLDSANPTPPYATWVTAATNIQDAVDVAATNDVVLVTNGLYATGGRANPWVFRVVVDKPVAVRSVNGPQFTVIQGDSDTGCLYLNNGATLSGFTLTNGLGAGGARGNNGFSPGTGTLYNCTLTKNGGGAVGCTLYNCTLTGNSGNERWAAALWCTLYNCTLTGNSGAEGGGASWSTLYNCTLTGNSGIYGGGVYGGTLYNCTLTGNSASLGGGAIGATLYNCTLNRNSAVQFGGGAAGCTLYNCTLTGNSAEVGGGGVTATGISAAPSTLYNCVVYFNMAPSGGANYEDGCTLNYCCTTPQPTNGVGNITNAPLFVNAAAGDFRLLRDSPCIDAGTNLTGIVSTDILGLPRPMDGNNDGVARFDIGAYEFNPYRFATTLGMGANGFHFTVCGEPGRSVRIERSRDLVNWGYAAEVPIPASGQTLIDPAANSESELFYRAIRVP